ncbi:quaternary ammonium compound-resistance protein SugE [Angulomicrobium tetraedrale]|uniref:Guanidinium exporter n=1 Tax=Ancylobacter tetraedralis TaxID=217068 RepID=A0A839Z6S6_9HYPH|nr:multidrug efflux SMR transporter [Ancylobacter tetraedralis]MBB3771392.1 quaternary ammonium compound-resistance protein SugE [Ancylobacter tetraedralis]
MAWAYLIIAALFEVVFALSMKYSDGFSRLWPSILTMVSVSASFTFLTLAIKDLPVSVAYPVWTAIGTLGTVLLGALVLGEALSPMKLVCVVIIVIGIAGLKVAA